MGRAGQGAISQEVIDGAFRDAKNVGGVFFGYWLVFHVQSQICGTGYSDRLGVRGGYWKIFSNKTQKTFERSLRFAMQLARQVPSVNLTY